MNNIKLLIKFSVVITLAGFLLSGCTRNESQDYVAYDFRSYFLHSHQTPFESSEYIVVVSDVDIFTTGISFYFQNNSDYVFTYHLLDWSLWSDTAQGWSLVNESAWFNSAMPNVGAGNYSPQRAGFNTYYTDFELAHGAYQFVRRFFNVCKEKSEFLIVEFEIDEDALCPVELSITRPRYDSWTGTNNAPPLIGSIEKNYEREWCWCGGHFVDEEPRRPTPPLNITEVLVDWQDDDEGMMLKILEVNEFIRDFEFVHEYTFNQSNVEWTNTIILWPDRIIRDFSFVHLHYDGDTIFTTVEVLLTIDELLPSHAVVLNVVFAHYLFPRGGIIFTDGNGEQRRMFIQESMVGGCVPLFHLVPLEDVFWAVWECGEPIPEPASQSEPMPTNPHPLNRALRDYMAGNIEVWNTLYEFRISNEARSAELVTLDDNGTIGVLLEIDDNVASKVLLYVYNDELFYSLEGWSTHGAFGAGRYNRMMSSMHGHVHIYTLESGRLVISTSWNPNWYAGFLFNGLLVTEDEFNTFVERAKTRYDLDESPAFSYGMAQILALTVNCTPELPR